MNKDFRVSVSLPSHPKALKLMRRCGDIAFYNLVKFWAFVAQNRPSGDLAGLDCEDIEIAAGWNGEVGVFHNALLDLKFIETVGKKTFVHDWKDHNGYACHAKERSERARMAAEVKWGKKPDKNKANRAQRMKEARLKGNHKNNEWEDMKLFFGTCVKCGGDTGLANVDRDHIIPVHMGGCHGIKNIQPLCAQCNASKSNDTTDYRVVFCEKNNLNIKPEWDKGLCLNDKCDMYDVCVMHANGRRQHTKTHAMTSAPSPNPTPDPDPNKLKDLPSNKFADDSIEIQLSKHLFSLIQDRNPKAKKPDFQKWAKHIDLMIRRDNRTEREVKAAIDWCQNDDFWFSNILSTDNLRKKYDKLYAAAQREKVNGQPKRYINNLKACQEFIDERF